MNTESTPKRQDKPAPPVCYICGRDGANSRDHVIPYSFFKSPRPADMLTLPAHYACHNNFDEEYARVILSAWDSKAAPVPKSYGTQRRSVPLSEGAAPEILRASLVPKIDLISPAGLVFDHTPGIRIETQRFYPLMRKIVQGLYAHHIGELLPPDFRSLWNPNALLELSTDRRRFLEASQFGIIYQEIFGCRYLLVDQGTTDASSVWWLCFYNDAVLRCFIPPRHLWSPRSK